MRADKRPATGLRELRARQGSLSAADGSSSFNFGPVCVCSTVTGPIEVRVRDELLDRATLQVNVLPSKGLPRPASKAVMRSLQLLLADLLLLHAMPRSLVQLTLQTLSLPSTRYTRPFRTFTDLDWSASLDEDGRENDEDEELDPEVSVSCVECAAMVNAATLACLDSGIAMRGTAAAVGIAWLGSSKGLALDPSPEEERDAQMCFVVAFTFGAGVGGSKGELVWCESVGGRNREPWSEELVSVLMLSASLSSLTS